MWAAFSVSVLVAGAPYEDVAIVGLFPPERESLMKGLDGLLDSALDAWSMEPVPDAKAIGVADFWDWYRKVVA